MATYISAVLAAADDQNMRLRANRTLKPTPFSFRSVLQPSEFKRVPTSPNRYAFL
jgi:hypothetical protein